MKYQVLKQLKTKTKRIALCDTINQALETLVKNKGAKFIEFSYIGGFPVFEDSNQCIYSIQGLADIGVLCSLSKDDLKVCSS